MLTRSQDASGNRVAFSLGMPSFGSRRVVKSSQQKNRDQGWRSTVGFFSGQKIRLPEAQIPPSGDLKPRNLVLDGVFLRIGISWDENHHLSNPPFGIIFLGHFFRLCIDHANHRKPGFFLMISTLLSPNDFNRIAGFGDQKPMLPKAIVSS